MASILDKIKRTVVNVMPFRAWQYMIQDADYKTVDDLDIIMNTAADDAISGQLVVLDQKGDTKKGAKIPLRLTKPNLVDRDYRPLFRNIFYGLHKNGVAHIWVTKSSYFFLEENNCEITYKNKSRLTLDGSNDKYKSFYYNSGGKRVNLLSEDGQIVEILDIGESQTNYQPITRISQIGGYMKMSAEALKASSGMFMRVALQFLFKKGVNGIPAKTISSMTDNDVNKEDEKWQNDKSITSGTVKVLPYEMGSIETNPDNRRLDAKTYLNLARERFCQQFKVPVEKFASETKYDDLKVVLTTYWGMTLPSVMDKIMKPLNEALGLKERVAMDYTYIIEKLIPNETEANENTSTEGAE